MLTDYITMLTETQEYAATEILYDEYMNCNPAFQTAQEADVAEISAILDKSVEAHSVSGEQLGEYEEAARRAGFYAGFKAAAAYLHFLWRYESRKEGDGADGE